MFKPERVVYWGLRGPFGVGSDTPKGRLKTSLMPLERATGEGKSPVSESLKSLNGYPKYHGIGQTCGNPGGPPPKAKYSLATDSERSTVKEVVKSSPVREVKSP